RGNRRHHSGKTAVGCVGDRDDVAVGARAIAEADRQRTQITLAVVDRGHLDRIAVVSPLGSSQAALAQAAEPKAAAIGGIIYGQSGGAAGRRVVGDADGSLNAGDAVRAAAYVHRVLAASAVKSQRSRGGEHVDGVAATAGIDRGVSAGCRVL